MRSQSPRLFAFLAVGITAPSMVCGQWTAIVLNPPGSIQSEIRAIDSVHAYGWGFVPVQSPLIWNGSPTSWTNLAQPPNGGEIDGAASDQLVGSYNGRACLWNGASHDFVDLTPAGSVGSTVYATTGEWQAGTTVSSGPGGHRAVAWHGSAASATILQPPGFFESKAVAADGQYQGGWIQLREGTGGGALHAALWSGTAQSMVDFNPPGAQSSAIYGMAHGQAVGAVGLPGGGSRAALWPSLTSPYIDLNPPGVIYAQANATCGTAQVGLASTANGGTAAIWFGSAASFTPLAPYLPPNYFSSGATCVAEANGVFYVGGWAINVDTSREEAVMWIGVPEPGLILPLACSVFGARRRRR